MRILLLVLIGHATTQKCALVIRSRLMTLLHVDLHKRFHFSHINTHTRSLFVVIQLIMMLMFPT